jgi:hypothetical protein
MAATSNYGFPLAGGSDPMSDVKTYVTDSFKKLESINNLTVIAAGQPLPQSGNYKLGDRVFRNDVAGGNTWPSNYILVVQDAVWGWHWRPIQQIVSPWVDVPAAVINDATFAMNTFKWQIAFDSRGFCHWRGSIKSVAVGITPGDYNILKNIPVGLRPAVRIVHGLALSPVSGGTSGLTSNVSARMRMFTDGSSSFRFYNSASTVQNIWLDGFSYIPSDHWFLNA